MVYEIEKVRYISHEVKNQLSICDLYTEIITRYCEKNCISDETILKAAENIKRAVKIAGNSLLELKSSEYMNISDYELVKLIEEAIILSKVYGENKSVQICINKKDNVKIRVDKDRFEGVLINIIKNACEAFDNETDKKIIIDTEKEDSIVKIKIKNNAKPIENPNEIFNENVTTKSTGSGLGLYIARRNVEEMSGSLKLLKSDIESTVFEICFKVID